MLVDLHLSVTNGSSQAQAWAAHFTDGNTNHYAIPPLKKYPQEVFLCLVRIHKRMYTLKVFKPPGINLIKEV